MNTPQDPDVSRPVRTAAERPSRAGAPLSGAPLSGAPSSGAPSSGRTVMARRSGPADPVRGLMHQHRRLCEQAVDPLEIAAGLEAHGVTDRTAARFRHRDVFSLAEELYARVPHAGAASGAPAADGPRGAAGGIAAGRVLLPLLPGALCAATLVGLALARHGSPLTRTALAVVGTAAVLAALRLGLVRLNPARPGPARPGHARPARVRGGLRACLRLNAAALWGLWLTGYAFFGDRLLGGLLADGGGGTAPALVGPPPSVPLSLALAFAPAAWCARWFAVRARRRLAASRSLVDFAAGVRPLLAAALALFTMSLVALQFGTRAAVGALSGGTGLGHLGSGEGGVSQGGAGELLGGTAVGVLLFLGLLLSAHGFASAASAGLGAACAVEGVPLVVALAARLPGLDPLGHPLTTAVTACGPAVVPVVACGCAGLGLLAYAARALTGASAHHRTAEPV